ncbi:uncharacterized protein LOC128876535 isoform X2 [Hylaeus volcanicus]|uniref:uncharacterized protein LOC128876535 isoform X2 n=1 Tax=Hylaeus volcanicus TaxID=313075 RepID=UPI0023B84C98|nr:uncharacterized protein LOC128876535 isoform X2 [Hylaeus volcanicus]
MPGALLYRTPGKQAIKLSRVTKHKQIGARTNRFTRPKSTVSRLAPFSLRLRQRSRHASCIQWSRPRATGNYRFIILAAKRRRGTEAVLRQARAWELFVKINEVRVDKGLKGDGISLRFFKNWGKKIVGSGRKIKRSEEN